MGVEIERKFLVVGQPWLGQPGTPISQAYLSRDPQRIVRVRLAGDQAWLTLKGPAAGLVRPEFEYPIPVEDARHLLDHLALPGRIDKTRYRLPYGNHTWEIDVFHGPLSGLVTAEVEMTAPGQPVELPAWIGREVTGDPAYSNSVLSAHPNAWRSSIS